jgi:hypothetical protein
MMFRELSSEEEKQFRTWARSNYKLGESISGIWHPIVQAECVRINEQAAFYTEETTEADR